MAVDALAEAGKYGMDQEGVVSANHFNYLLSQLYIAGDTDGELCANHACTQICGSAKSYSSMPIPFQIYSSAKS